MEKARDGYHGRISVLTQHQIEVSRAVLRAEAGIEREKSVPKEQYWVRFGQVTIGDLNALMVIYERLTDYSPLPLEEEDFNRLHEEFTSNYGLGEVEIKTGSNLEARRRIGPDRELFVRFKITGRHVGMQEEIDAYFLSKNMAVPLRQTY